jgi:hypothetical protein
MEALSVWTVCPISLPILREHNGFYLFRKVYVFTSLSLSLCAKVQLIFI